MEFYINLNNYGIILYYAGRATSKPLSYFQISVLLKHLKRELVLLSYCQLINMVLKIENIFNTKQNKLCI